MQIPETAPSESNDPLVSVIIPFYNREEFLAEAVESVKAQTHQSWELILVDDGSTDEGRHIAEGIAEDHPDNVFLFSHENRSHRGASSSRNLGIEHASGELITFLDSDDVFMPHTLETAVSAFRQEPNADVVCGSLKYWFSWDLELNKGERDFIVDLGIETGKVYSPPSLFVHNLDARGRKPGIGCVVLRSDLAKRYKLFEDDFRYVSEDQLFWAKVSLQSKIYVLKDCFAKYRQHKKSSTAILLESGKMVSDWNEFLDWLENYLDENNIEDPKIWNALNGCRQENLYRSKFGPVLNLYRRILPFHVRYRIRDLIIKWRSRD